MADYNINIPGNPGVDMLVGDTLTITFISPAKFCITSGNPNAFSPALPVGVAEPKDYVWSGTATATTSISYSSVGHDKACGSPNPTATTPGTIVVGSGMK
jgi:hypothetical protein